MTDRATSFDYLSSNNGDTGRRYAEVVTGLHYAVVDFSTDSENIQTDDVTRIIRDNTALAHANSVGSAVQRNGKPTGQHRPVLDLDMDVLVVPSSTHGHHHLYIDHSMPWRDYHLLLTVLGHVGILQPGYVNASHHRRESFVRTPWTRKGEGPVQEVPF